jgi:hypothetical protein
MNVGRGHGNMNQISEFQGQRNQQQLWIRNVTSL